MIYLRTSAGIEIRREDLVITCLQSNFAAGVFTHFKRVRDFRTRDREELRKEIDAFFRASRLGRDNITLGLRRTDVIVRHLDLPPEVAENLKQVVQFQVQSFEPTEEERLYFDYAPLRSAPGAKRLTVLLVLIKKSALDEQLARLQELGIRPASITIPSVGMVNLFCGMTSGPANGKIYFLVDASAGGVVMTGVKDGGLVYSHEAARRDGESWRDLITGELEMAVGKMRLEPEDTVERILLAGEEASAALQELREALPDCELMSERIQFEMPVEHRSHLGEAIASLGLAYSGLAHRPPVKINLVPSEMRVRQTGWAYVPAIILGVAILALLAGLGFRQLVQERMLIRKLDQEIEKLKAPVSRVQAIRSESEALKSQVQRLEALLRQRDMNLETLRELTTILPPDTFLNVYINKQGSIQLSGSSSSAADLVSKLEKSPLIMNVQQKGTIFKDAQTGKDRFNFESKLER